MAEDSSHTLCPTSVAPDASPLGGQQDRGPGARRRGRGAQPGNMNAQAHGAYRRDLNAAKVEARVQRDRHHRAARREARAILTAYSLDGNPLAVYIGRNLARLEAMTHRLEAHHNRRGYFDKSGALKPSAVREVDVVAQAIGESRRLLDQVSAAAAPQQPVEVRHVFSACARCGQPPFPQQGLRRTAAAAAAVGAGIMLETTRLDADPDEADPLPDAAAGPLARDRAAEAGQSLPAVESQGAGPSAREPLADVAPSQPADPVPAAAAAARDAPSRQDDSTKAADAQQKPAQQRRVPNEDPLGLGWRPWGGE